MLVVVGPADPLWGGNLLPVRSKKYFNFQFIENSMLGQFSKIIRTALYRAKCLWCQELMGSAGGLFCKSITQDQLDSVINVMIILSRYFCSQSHLAAWRKKLTSPIICFNIPLLYHSNHNLKISVTPIKGWRNARTASVRNFWRRLQSLWLCPSQKLSSAHSRQGR